MNDYSIEIFRLNSSGQYVKYDTHAFKAANEDVANTIATEYIESCYGGERYCYKNLKLVKEFYNPDGEI